MPTTTITAACKAPRFHVYVGDALWCSPTQTTKTTFLASGTQELAWDMTGDPGDAITITVTNTNGLNKTFTAKIADDDQRENNVTTFDN